MRTPHQPDSTPARSFSDTRVIILRPGDERLAAISYSDTAVGFEQTEDARTFLVIGHQAPEDAIERGCRRFGLDPCQVRTALASDAGARP